MYIMYLSCANINSAGALGLTSIWRFPKCAKDGGGLVKVVAAYCVLTLHLIKLCATMILMFYLPQPPFQG